MKDFKVKFSDIEKCLEVGIMFGKITNAQANYILGSIQFACKPKPKEKKGGNNEQG